MRQMLWTFSDEVFINLPKWKLEKEFMNEKQEERGKEWQKKLFQIDGVSRWNIFANYALQ